MIVETCPVTLAIDLSIFENALLSVSIGSPALLNTASLSNTRATDPKMASCVDLELDGYAVTQCSKNTSWYFSVKLNIQVRKKTDI